MPKNNITFWEHAKQERIRKKRLLRIKKAYLLMQKQKKKKERLKEKKERKLSDQLEKAEYHKMITKLQETSQVKINELLSDNRFLNIGFFKKIKHKFMPGSKFCSVTLHCPDNIDIVRYFPMPKPFTLDINKKYYLFSPKSFRYINNTAHLYFYHAVPFAILHNPSKTYNIPSLDTDAFTSVQRSKFIQDVTSGEETIGKGLMIAVIVIVGVCLVIGIINSAILFQLLKAMKP